MLTRMFETRVMMLVDASRSMRLHACGTASTGGIPAFGNFLTHLDPRIAAPILLTQHLPDAFMEFYARTIGLMTQRRMRVAAAGMSVEPHHIYLTPGDHPLMDVSHGRPRAIALDRRPVAHSVRHSAE